MDYHVKEKTIDLQDKILDVQSQQIDLKDLLASAKQRIIDLEDEKKQREQWDAKKSCYLLCEIIPGTYVYQVDPAKKPDAPLHHICPACYEKSVKSIL